MKGKTHAHELQDARSGLAAAGLIDGQTARGLGDLGHCTPRLRVGKDTGAGPAGDPGRGDHLQVDVDPGDDFGIALFAPHPGDKFFLFYQVNCVGPFQFLAVPINTIPDADGDGAHVRLSSVWPNGLASICLQAICLHSNNTSHGLANIGKIF